MTNFSPGQTQQLAGAFVLAAPDGACRSAAGKPVKDLTPITTHRNPTEFLDTYCRELASKPCTAHFQKAGEAAPMCPDLKRFPCAPHLRQIARTLDKTCEAFPHPQAVLAAPSLVKLGGARRQ